MTRNSFLNLKFPVLPYSSHKRGPSTVFDESFHVSKNRITVNFHWRCDGKVSVGVYDANIKDECDRLSTVIHLANTLSAKTIEDILTGPT